MPTSSSSTPAGPEVTSAGHWRDVVARYQQTHVWRAFGQLATTILPLVVGFVLMVLALEWSYLITLALAVPTAGFLVRTFIIMHDCAHSSFLPWRGVNDMVGSLTGLLTLTPFAQWRRDHAIHHASSGDLDRRGHGDVDTITVTEYLALSPSGRFRYRMKRHPVALLLVGPLYLMYSQRFRPRGKATKDKQVASVWGTNVAILLALAVAFAFGGLGAALMVYLPVLYLAGIAGVYLFYVQHQFENTYWAQHEDWDYATASIAGSSYLMLPRPLAWLTGDIGVHHVHHMGPRIPNYLLKRAHDENPLFHAVTVVRMRDTGRALRLALWDEAAGKLISFRELNARGAAA